MTQLTFLSCFMFFSGLLRGQANLPDAKQQLTFASLIDKYSEAREKRDTILLRSILATDIDQLVSNGEWRQGIDASVKGMLNSSASNPGTRALTIDKMRMLGPDNAIVDCRYEIQNADGKPRRMWSTFILIASQGNWKISAIRNMLPAAP